ncbi:hypothetical protein Poli38472_014749 [Pythium oligandrum]|uniref:AB hydrolase-1 domain-containing protein n=1 Tax=Pythium oligandrum TaxID=41045 RepID=A0A8K1C216_PYTOL|nr:hypothetical protein Poli38472_014749 [Pythium oligandrum]|eukprot:TMW54978.1 hypothetical protein Poli38472_014749 [Pythium oligandrum]
MPWTSATPTCKLTIHCPIRLLHANLRSSGARLVSLASANSLPINGWYSCSYSNYVATGSVPGINSTEELLFECAEVKVPLCHEGICGSGTKIDVFVKRIAAHEDVGAGKSLWVLQGGPGMSSVDQTTMEQLYNQLNGTANLYTMDHRGTGRSYLLKCDAAGAFTTGSPGGSSVNITEAARCGKDILFQIENQTAAFSVTSAAKDVVLLSSELNKDEEVFVYGASYGTYLTERMMHLAPPHVTGYVLDGVISEKLSSFAHFGSNREDPGRYFAGLCDDDAICREKYGSDVPKDQKMYDVWLDTYKKLDAAKVGENACADLLRGEWEKVLPSEMLRDVFAKEVSIGDPSGRTLIPAFLQMLRRCDATDVTVVATLMALSGAPSYFDKSIDRSTERTKIADNLNGPSGFLMFAIKNSELWSDPSPTFEDEKALVEHGIFRGNMKEEYTWHCLLTGNRDDPSCAALTYSGATEVPPVDYSSVELIDFTYKPDQYHRQYAKVPEGASVMVINGKLDFQTVHSWGKDQYENMEGSKKLLDEFDFGPHCVGITASTPDDTTNCGIRIIASYVAAGGDTEKTDISCLSKVPKINFDVDELVNNIKNATTANITTVGQS